MHRDFIIYGLDIAGSSAEANLVGVNNLYVGAAGGGGCGAPSGGTGNGGAGTAPTPQVMWAFNVGGSIIATSVVLNLTGTKVAYVLNSDPPVLQVLTLPSAQTGTINSPTTPSTTCNGTAPSVCSVTLSSSTADYFSPPYVDYGNDAGYVGDDSGHLYKITNFFSKNGTAPALAGGSWPVAAGSTNLSGAVYDGNTGTVFVSSANGKEYGFTSSGTAITGSPLTLATSGGTSGGIYASPIVDSTNHVLYVAYGDNAAGTAAEVAQVVYYNSSNSTVEFVSGSAGTPGSSSSTAGTNKAAFLTTTAGNYVMNIGAFSQSYFSGFSSTTSFLYECGTTSTGGVSLQQFSFNSSGVLQTTAHQVDSFGTPPTAGAGYAPCGPLTEFYNTNGTPTDWLFVAVYTTQGDTPQPNNLLSFNITNNSLGGALSSTATFTSNLGASGIIVDGADPTSNASSLYFTSWGTATCITEANASPSNSRIGTTVTAPCAYKLTQSGLD